MRLFVQFAVIIAICSSIFLAVAQDKVVVIPLNTKAATAPDKLWGQGRPGVSLLTHATPVDSQLIRTKIS